PHAVSAAAGVDAMAHAVESYVTKRRNDVSQLYAREAWRRVERSLEGHLADPAKLGAAGDLLLGAHFGGAAIEASMLGAAHSLANPLTARFGVVHGAAVGAMLPHVVRFNGDDAEIRSLYAELAKAAELDPAAESGAADRGNDHVSALAARIEALLETARLPRRLAEHGVEDGHLADLAEGAAEQWTARFNPRQLVTGDFERLYRAAL
ncbi:MAG: iron-containing alcohol dehydrogenase, partial [Acidobacteriota bacterium]